MVATTWAHHFESNFDHNENRTKMFAVLIETLFGTDFALADQILAEKWEYLYDYLMCLHCLLENFFVSTIHLLGNLWNVTVHENSLIWYANTRFDNLFNLAFAGQRKTATTVQISTSTIIDFLDRRILSYLTKVSIIIWSIFVNHNKLVEDSNCCLGLVLFGAATISIRRSLIWRRLAKAIWDIGSTHLSSSFIVFTGNSWDFT